MEYFCIINSMNKLINILSEVFSRISPAEPIRISFSKFKTFLFFLMIVFISTFIYLRRQNKNELELLNAEHKKMQLLIQDYLDDMSYNKINRGKFDELNGKILLYKKKLHIIEKDINRIKNVWFMR